MHVPSKYREIGTQHAREKMTKTKGSLVFVHLFKKKRSVFEVLSVFLKKHPMPEQRELLEGERKRLERMRITTAALWRRLLRNQQLGASPVLIGSLPPANITPASGYLQSPILKPHPTGLLLCLVQQAYAPHCTPRACAPPELRCTWHRAPRGE